MASFTITVPVGDATQTLTDRATSLGYTDVKAMTIDLLKQQYRIQKRLANKAQAQAIATSSTTDPTLT